jgi:hypothetical protein
MDPGFSWADFLVGKKIPPGSLAFAKIAVELQAALLAP